MHLLGHEGDGGLSHRLKKEQLIHELTASETYDGAKGFDFLHLTILLTSMGAGHIDKIMNYLYQYISMIISEQPQEWIFKELQDTLNLDFEYQSDEAPAELVESFAYNLHWFDLEDVVRVPYMMSEYSPTLIDQVLRQYLKPSNMLMVLLSKALEGDVTKVEPWYGTQYSTRTGKFSDINFPLSIVDSGFHLPQRNKFIPTRLDLACRDHKNKAYPRLLKDSDLARCWYKQDNRFFLPVTYFAALISCPLVSSNAREFVHAKIFTKLLVEDLMKCAYSAELAGISYSFKATISGFQLKTDGYSSNIGILLRQIVGKMVRPDFTEQQFTAQLGRYKMELDNCRLSDPAAHAEFYLRLLLRERHFSLSELSAACKHVTLSSVAGFAHNCFSSIFCECLIYGNSTPRGAVRLFRTLLGPFQKKVRARALPVTQRRHVTTEVKLNKGEPYYYESSHPVSVQSCIYCYYQLGADTAKQRALLSLLLQIMEEPCYHFLRTEHQLGYFVDVIPRKEGNSLGFAVIVQSDKDVGFVERKIEEFLSSMLRTLQTMKTKSFSIHKRVVKNHLSGIPSEMGGKFETCLDEIVIQRYSFFSSKEEARALKEVELPDLISFYKKSVINQVTRSKLTILIYRSKEAREAAKEDWTTEKHIITDTSAFKNSNSLFPHHVPSPPEALENSCTTM